MGVHGTYPPNSKSQGMTGSFWNTRVVTGENNKIVKPILKSLAIYRGPTAPPLFSLMYTPLKTNMTGWKIPMFNRKYINSFMVDFPASHVSFRVGIYIYMSMYIYTISFPGAVAAVAAPSPTFSQSKTPFGVEDKPAIRFVHIFFVPPPKGVTKTRVFRDSAGGLFVWWFGVHVSGAGGFVWQGFTIENAVDFVFLRTSGDDTWKNSYLKTGWWLNHPSEKYASKWKSSPPIIGWWKIAPEKLPKPNRKVVFQPPCFKLGGVRVITHSI